MMDWMKLISTVFLLVTTSCSLKTNHKDDQDLTTRSAANDLPARSAYDVYAELQEAATTYNVKALFVDGQSMQGFDAGVTWGAEKEASSSLITRIMGPPASLLSHAVSKLPDNQRQEFLSDFLTNYIKDANGYRTYINDQGTKIDLAVAVKDKDGQAKLIDLNQLKGIDYTSSELRVLDEKFASFLDMTDGRPLAFIKPSVRAKLFKGNLPGLTRDFFPKNYYEYVPHFGNAERYISDAHPTYIAKGWELGFVPQQSYGEFEAMVTWFRTELKNAGKLFQAPGHQRMVFLEHPRLPKDKLSETYRMIQALIVLDGIKGNTGIELANFKQVQTDSGLESLITARGVIRLEGNRWGQNTHGIEFRAGTKDITTARFTQSVLAARVASNDFSGLASISDYTLYDGQNVGAERLQQRFGVSAEVAKSAISNLDSLFSSKSFVVPFWHWEDQNVPFLSRPKKELIKSMTIAFIEKVSELNEISADQRKKYVRALMRDWVKSTNLAEEVRTYLRPKLNFSLTENLLHFPVKEGAYIDVNKIDLGIEYSGRMPLRVGINATDDKLTDGKRAWLTTKYDLTDQERDGLIKKVATDLSKELGSNGEPSKVVGDGGHGHGLELSYEIRDPQNRKWVVEWDGIGRSYDPAGNVIENSQRAGSIELVTPKFVPNVNEMQAVFKAFELNNVMPRLLAGGGHINIDLAAFENNPRALARFISIFNEHRGVIALMFQHLNRLKSGEPIEISDNLSAALKDFRGSEQDLKQLLYNERYFNTRYGRKSRYVQFDLSAYFQDVIPEEFITEDFDIANPNVPWRRQFRVDPQIRKGEFRLFNAPRDAAESALQIRLVRAMLNKALNEDMPLSGKVQKVDHLAYLKNPTTAFSDLEKMTADLNLNINDYRPAVAEGLSETDLVVRSVFFENLDEKLRLHPKQSGWSQAVSPRQTPIASQGRYWTPGPADQLNTMDHSHRQLAAEEAMRRRSSISPSRSVPDSLIRSENCINAVTPFL